MAQVSWNEGIKLQSYLLKSRRNFQRLIQQDEIKAAGNLDGAELPCMRIDILRVEEDIAAVAQPVNKPVESRLRGVGHVVEHRFTKKSAAHSKPVQTADKFAVFPCLDGMRNPHIMNLRIKEDELFRNPGILAVGAASHNFFKGCVDSEFEIMFPDCLAQ